MIAIAFVLGFLLGVFALHVYMSKVVTLAVRYSAKSRRNVLTWMHDNYPEDYHAICRPAEDDEAEFGPLTPHVPSLDETKH
jgi:hypothetical protein